MAHLFARQQTAQDVERIANRGEGLPGEAHLLDQPSDSRADAQHRAAFCQFVESGELHRDQSRMMAVHIDDAEADAQPAGHPGASRGRRHDAALKRVFREPYRGEAIRLGDIRQLDALPRVKPAMQPQPDGRQLRHGAGSNPAGARRRRRLGEVDVNDPPIAV